MEKELAKAIGISNFTITKTENLLKTAKVTPAINQGKINEGIVQFNGIWNLYRVNTAQ